VSPALPVVGSAEVIAALAKAGFVQVSQRGSHVKLRSGGRTVIVPMHRELAAGTLRSVLRQAGLTPVELSLFSDAFTGRTRRGGPWCAGRPRTRSPSTRGPRFAFWEAGAPLR
jgi:predicted RNA binding protein YcfA (HicA-like mRNA interferase family)